MAELHARARHWIALRTTDNATALRALAGATADTNGWLRIKAVDDTTAGQLSLCLAQQGVGIVRMEERSQSLEDIFLQLTGMEATI